MAEDPRRAVVEVIARLGRETQLHIDERYRHFRITDAVILGISLLLVILAVFNVYYVRILYKDLDGIVNNMDAMYAHLRDVDADMSIIAQTMESFDGHTAHMEAINTHMASLARTLPSVRADMRQITNDTSNIQQSMDLVARGMVIIDQRVHLMTGSVAVMRENVGQFARPMGSMMPFMP
ncbi:MAG: translation initiation factor 2 [Bdellovibrio bacteriovorus]